MALRPWSGPIVLEDTQTGDGRVIALGALSAAPFPLPFASIASGDQHVDVLMAAPQVGTIESIDIDGGVATGHGFIDDAIPEGAELIRRMEAGSASHGHETFVSIDPDDWAMDILVDADDEEDVVIVAAAGTCPPGATWVNWHPLRAMARSGLVAAAGDADPGDSEKYTLVFQDRADMVLARFTQLRIRGVTACAVSAFDGAHIGLDAAETASAFSALTDTNVVAYSSGGACVPVTSAYTVTAFNVNLRAPAAPAAPALEVFDEPGEPDGSLNVDDYRVHGYVALWDACHTGYTDRCVSPPREPDYSVYRHGSVVTEDGTAVATGPLTWGIPHADLDLDLIAAFAHYADSRHGFADVVVGANQYGIWHAGSLRPGVTADDVRVLRALSISGDWRWHVQSSRLRLIAGLAVNHPGFPVPRLTASGAARRALAWSGPKAEVRIEHGHVHALVAAGMLRPADYEVHGCSCGDSRVRLEEAVLLESALDPTMAEILDRVKAIDLRTRHLSEGAAEALRRRITTARGS